LGARALQTTPIEDFAFTAGAVELWESLDLMAQLKRRLFPLVLT
jgi:hypothetical protein